MKIKAWIEDGAEFSKRICVIEKGETLGDQEAVQKRTCSGRPSK